MDLIFCGLGWDGLSLFLVDTIYFYSQFDLYGAGFLAKEGAVCLLSLESLNGLVLVFGWVYLCPFQRGLRWGLGGKGSFGLRWVG